jgi:2-polyprenyl-3-methyl-5-hydroxy-6-metoxy-1,4-benzoquinol methylase
MEIASEQSGSPFLYQSKQIWMTFSMTHNDIDAQEFWLKQLGGTSAINDWYFSKFSEHLGSRILEIGCGVGTFTRLMGETGARVHGLDINHDFVEMAARATDNIAGVTIELADVTNRDWDKDYDTVVALDVIEHIEDDIAMLKTMYDALDPGGRIVIKVPAMPSIHGSLDEVVGHYRRYTIQTISHALTTAGFKNIQVDYFNTLGIIGWWINGRLLKRQVPPAGQVKMFEILLPIVKFLDRISPNRLGLSLVAVATR